MGLFSTTIHRHEPAYPQEVNHHYDTPPQALAKLDEMRERMARQLTEIDVPDNAVKMKAFQDESCDGIRIVFSINGQPFNILVPTADINLAVKSANEVVAWHVTDAIATDHQQRSER